MKGTAVAAGAAMASSLLSPPAVHAASEDTIKIALIGCGGRGKGAATQAMSTKGPTKLIAVADAFEDNAKGAVRELKGQSGDKVQVEDDHVFWGFDAYEKALAAGPDMVILATPPGFRPMHFEAAVKAGKHIFMEKPVSTDAPGVRKVLAAAQEAKRKNLKVAVGLQRHHSPRYIETVRRIQDGELGHVDLLRVYWNGDTPWVRARRPEQTEMEYQMRNWYFFVWLCGDHINEQHIHNLDVANWIKNGPPAQVQGMGGRQVRTGIDHGEIYDHHMLEYTYPDGTTMMSQCRHQPNTQQNVSEHANGSEGYSNVGDGYIRRRDGSEWRYKGHNPNDYQTEHDDFFEAIRMDKPYNEAEYGATSTMTALMGRMATYTGRVIKWEEALNSKVSVMPQHYAWDAAPPTVPGPDGRYKIAMPGVDVRKILETLPETM